MIAAMAKVVGYMKPDIDPGLRLHVPFTEGIGNVAKDYSRHHNHAAFTDVEWGIGKNGNAGKFNGTSAFCDCGNDESLNITDEITIEAWVKPNDISGDRAIVVKGDRDVLTTNYHFGFTNNKLNFVSYDGSNWHDLQSDLSPTVGEWQHLAAVYTGTKVRFYKNGVEDEKDYNYALIANDDVLRIGNRKYSVPNYQFNGTIDEVRIYNRALSAAQNAADCYEACN